MGIPVKYGQAALVAEIKQAGFDGAFDFVYVPTLPRSRFNRGFAFLNFCDAAGAQRFYAMFHGARLCRYAADGPLEVLPADVQGFSETASRFLNSKSGKKKKKQSVFFEHTEGRSQ